MSKIDFTGKKVFVTGAASGMGRASALLAAEFGADVAVADMNEEQAAVTVAKIEAMGRKAKAYCLDISDAEQVDAVCKKAWDDFGGFEAVIHAAGIVMLNMVGDENAVARFDKTIAVNLRGTFLIDRVFSELMKERKYGRIVNFSSIAGKIGEANNAAYCASKGGVSLFTQSLALEMAPYNVTVNAVAPGKIMTEQTVGVAGRWAAANNSTPEVFYKMVTDSVPMDRYGMPEEVADCVLFLASDMAAYITGQVFTVAGGQTLI